MIRIVQGLAVIFATTLVCSGLARAQQPPANPEVPATSRTLNLSLEQKHVVRELLKDSKVAPAAVTTKVSAGEQVPAAVALHPIPPAIGQKVPQIKSHLFYWTKAQIVIVDPQDRKVAEVID